MAKTLTGVEQLDKRLAALSGKEMRKAARKALGKGLRTIAKGMRSEIPTQFKDAKRAIGSKFNKKGGANRDQIQAKAGAGVGQSKKATEKVIEKQKQRRKGHPGVGISARNIQWFVLGTMNRKRKRIGGFAKKLKGASKSTGKMPPQIPDAIETGFEKSAGAAAAEIVQSLRQSIAIEARK